MNFYKKTSQVHYDSETFSIFAFIFVLSFLQYRSNNPRLASRLLKCCYNLVLMVGAKCLHGDPKLYSCISVGAYKLVVIQFDDISLIFSDDAGYSYELTWLVRDEDGDSEDSVSLDETVLYNGGHGDDVHVSTT